MVAAPSKGFRRVHWFMAINLAMKAGYLQKSLPPVMPASDILTISELLKEKLTDSWLVERPRSVLFIQQYMACWSDQHREWSYQSDSSSQSALQNWGLSIQLYIMNKDRYTSKWRIHFERTAIFPKWIASAGPFWQRHIYRSDYHSAYGIKLAGQKRRYAYICMSNSIL